jgi:hypothetical protein
MLAQPDRLLTVHEVSRRLRLSEGTVRRKTGNGELQPYVPSSRATTAIRSASASMRRMLGATRRCGPDEGPNFFSPRLEAVQMVFEDVRVEIA